MFPEIRNRDRDEPFQRIVFPGMSNRFSLWKSGFEPCFSSILKNRYSRSENLTTNVYEGLFILDSDLYARNPDEISGQIDKFIDQFEGEVLVSRLWEERKLAYPIKGHRRGTYWLAYFKLDATKVKELNRQCQISEGILRFLFLKIDPRLVETLVEHAKAGPIRPVAEPSEEAMEGRQGEDIFEETAVPGDAKPLSDQG